MVLNKLLNLNSLDRYVKFCKIHLVNLAALVKQKGVDDRSNTRKIKIYLFRENHITDF